ncbi:MAG: hypothetical protein AAB341_01060 [Planctomycetota bacterium]
MICVVVNFLQTAGAILVAVCGAVSFFTVPALTLPVTPRDCAMIQFHEGRFRLFWIESTDRPLGVELIGGGPNIRAYSRRADWPPLPPELVGVDVPREQDWDRWISIGGFRQVPSFGGSWRSPFGAAMFQPSPGRVSYVRLPVWLPCLLLLYRPCWAIVHGVRERFRRRNNLCLKCGYHLKGLIEPRCPECGSPVPPGVTDKAPAKCGQPHRGE